eukprot:m.41163 g.41163  ORF g.41163 m.41163 type:complete len:438 (-) comp18716_c0_seq1:81-1394(-)
MAPSRLLVIALVAIACLCVWTFHATSHVLTPPQRPKTMNRVQDRRDQRVQSNDPLESIIKNRRGVHVLEHGCIQMSPRDKVPKIGVLASAVRSPQFEPPQFPSKWWMYALGWDGTTVLDEKNATLNNNSLVYINIQGYYGTNPQHCLSDNLVPLFLDCVKYPKQPLSITSYVLHGDSNSFCDQTIRRLRIVEGDGVDVSGWQCFREIAFPVRNLFRMPLENMHMTDAETTKVFEGVPHLQRANEYLFSSTPPWTWLSSVTRTRTECESWERGFGDDAPLPKEVINDTPFVLIYDREENGNNRRCLENGLELQRALKEFYGDTLPVVLIHKLGGLSLCQQARLFKTAVVVIFPHGGQSANVIYSQPGTEIIELFCGRPDERGGINSGFYSNLMGHRWTTFHEPSCTSETMKPGQYTWLGKFNATIPKVLELLDKPKVV